MNSNELTRKVMEIVKNQIEPMVTEYMKEHPEYFHNCVSGAGMISNFGIELSYQPRSLSAVADINTPSLISVRIGSSNIGHELIKFSCCTDMESDWYIDGHCHTVRTA